MEIADGGNAQLTTGQGHPFDHGRRYSKDGPEPSNYEETVASMHGPASDSTFV
jgi:hypothetical protein